MVSEVYEMFRYVIKTRGLRFKTVIEVGAMYEDDTLLTLPELADCDRYGLNPGYHNKADEKKYEFRIYERHICPSMDANTDLILCNSVIEHDVFWWETIRSMHKCLSLFGAMIVCAPGFSSDASKNFDVNGEACTATMAYHSCPFDLYRFSEIGFGYGVLGELHGVQAITFMHPPRIIGIGINHTDWQGMDV